MRRFARTSLKIGISRDAVTVLHQIGWLRQETELISRQSIEAAGSDRAQLASMLDNILAEGEYSHLATTVIVADDCARLFMVTPPRNTTRLQDCRAAVDMRFRSLYGENSNDWQLSADWDVRTPFLACALPRTLLDAVQQAARKHHLTLIEIVPHFIAAWNHWSASLKAEAWFAVNCGGTLTLAAIEDRRLHAIRSTPWPNNIQEANQWLSNRIACEALRLNLAAPRYVQLCGDLVGQPSSHTEGILTIEYLGTGQLPIDSLVSPTRTTLASKGL